MLAAGMRLYRLGEWPPGPYRDEAWNGLDALGVLDGHHTLFFPANNGREPFYIYLVALSIALFGPTAFALRLPAALAGALATIPTYLLGREWFGRATGLFAAVLWAVTFWPVHLGRIGLRAGLLAPLLALAFWLGTRAWRERRSTLWLAAGVVYGLSFYTYLAVRFTPLVLVLFAAYLVATGRRARLWDGGRVLWFAVGAAAVVAPLALTLAADPSLLFGRAGQVSILSPEINGGNLPGALLGNVGRALGMYIWRGDTILRHNALLDYSGTPAGRPVFDWLMIGPFLAGLGWCLWRWRRPAAALLLIWQLVMLGPTILAEDAPHFLRVAGVLPGAVFLPAIGLGLLWDWSRLSVGLRRGIALLLLGGSALLAARDYATYAQQPDVAFLWEAAASGLAQSAAADAEAGLDVYLDTRFSDGWPSIRYLLHGLTIASFDPAIGLPPLDGAAAVYAWPYDSLDYLARAVVAPAQVTVEPGPLARGDLEPEPYSLYTRYLIAPGAVTGQPAATFGDRFRLHEPKATLVAPDVVDISLAWEVEAANIGDDGRVPNVFIHVIGPEGILAQHDGPLAGGLWPAGGWRSGVLVGERHTLQLPRLFNPASDQVQIGLYWGDTSGRLPAFGADGAAPDDKVIIRPEP